MGRGRARFLKTQREKEKADLPTQLAPSFFAFFQDIGSRNASKHVPSKKRLINLHERMIISATFVGYDDWTHRQEEGQDCGRHDHNEREIKDNRDETSRITQETTKNKENSDHHGCKKGEQVLLTSKGSGEPNGAISAQKSRLKSETAS